MQYWARAQINDREEPELNGEWNIRMCYKKATHELDAFRWIVFRQFSSFDLNPAWKMLIADTCV